MKEKHILNIGLPKCGTTWLWTQLSKHPNVCLDGLEKESPYFLENNNIHEYKKLYSDYAISANFHVANWQVDQHLIKSLDSCSTHISLLVSDPYLFIDRYYNWLKTTMSCEEFINLCINSKNICYEEIANRWIRNLSNSKFKILIYDDLVNDPDKFLAEYFNFCNLPAVVIPNANNIVNKNLQKKISVEFSKNQINIINAEINKFEILTNREFQHWKR